MALPQPLLTSDSGVMVTFGIVNTISGERSAVVMPMAESLRTRPRADLCNDALLMAQNRILPTLQLCMSVDYEVRFINCEAMVNGNLPARNDYGAGTFPGSGTTNAVPDNVAMLITFYGDPEQTPPPPHNRTRIGKNYIPGLSRDMLVGDTVDVAIVAQLQALADQVAQGVLGVSGDTGYWWRVVKQMRPPASPLINTWIPHAREYVVTQRRRLIPR